MHAFHMKDLGLLAYFLTLELWERKFVNKNKRTEALIAHAQILTPNLLTDILIKVNIKNRWDEGDYVSKINPYYYNMARHLSYKVYHLLFYK